MSAAARPRRSSRLTDLALGMRMSVGGGRQGWARLALIAVGVGVGVAMLLLVASLPAVLDSRTARSDARLPQVEEGLIAGEGTMLTQRINGVFRNEPVQGRLLQPEGPAAPLPPGVDRQLAPGDVVLSPALAALLESADGESLRGRWGDRVVGTIGPRGLTGPAELAFYLGTDALTDETATRIAAFGADGPGAGTVDPMFVLVGLVGLAVLLVPVAGFIGTAVRFGGEARDRRLAALRLVGADEATTRRVAAGETLVGSLLGLAVGGLLLLAARGVVAPLVPGRLTFYPADLRPEPFLVAVVAVAVPVASVLVTQSALRRVVVEPLGVVRRAAVTRRRLWWRLVVPAAGLVLMHPLIGGLEASTGDQAMVAAGLVLLLVGLGLLLPWIVDVVVRRLRPGSVAWDLALRRLQLESGSAVRAVSAIVVSVAGLIGLHGLVSGVSALVEQDGGSRSAMFQVEVIDISGTPDRDWVVELAGTPGVMQVEVERMVTAHDVATGEPMHVDIGSCAVLAHRVGPVDCADGDVVVVMPPGTEAPAAGTSYVLGEPGSDSSTWTLPAGTATVVPSPETAMPSPEAGVLPAWLYITPAALGDAVVDAGYSPVHVALDPTDPDAVDRLRTTTARVDPTVYVAVLTGEGMVAAFDTIRQVVLVITVALLAVVGASLLITVAEQLRERRRPLAVLMAFGTRRRTLGLSVLWQVAIPVALGLSLAVLAGSVLSMALQVGARAPITVDWAGIGTTAGGAALVVLLVTAASLPLLTGLTRTASLQAE